MSVRPSPAQLGRMALTPKWLGLAVVLVVGIVLCVIAGRWQFSRTMDVLDAERAAQQAPIAVEQVALLDRPLGGDAVGRPVTATGQYLADEQVVVLHRSLDGQPGVWVVTPLELDDGSLIAVVRGWLPDAADSVPPTGRVDVTGALHPDERFYADARPPAGTAVAISSARLAQGWPAPTRPGFVILDGQQPTSPDDPRPVPSTVSVTDVPFPVRNFVYALQWFVFALFAALVYLRWLWLDAVRACEEQGESSEGRLQHVP